MPNFAGSDGTRLFYTDWGADRLGAGQARGVRGRGVARQQLLGAAAPDNPDGVPGEVVEAMASASTVRPGSRSRR